MAVFKCKMCGGNLEVQDGMTVCECEYCGSIQTIPNLDDEKKINLFTRANRLRSACEFDKAAGVYESIVAEFQEEAEAYWGLILCTFGIEYVDDPKTGKKIPTCHRSSFNSVLEDPNFELVMEYSDPTSRAIYRDEAKAIEELRKNIIEVSSKEDPYDIFICYKETDAMGERTIDSVIAQDVYDALTEKGYKVFFSRITLEDKLGEEYEPYIFAALNSAKVMLAFGTDYEYYNAVWVKNEWSRFLSLIEKGEKKTLIPCFKGIDAYDMPKEFARLQAQDMGKVGAIQDLLRGIGKILGTNSKPANPGYTGTIGAEESALDQRGNMALEDGDFEGAEGYFERALDANPFDAKAYLGKFLAIVHVASLADFKDKVCWLEDAKEFKRAEQFADPSLAEELKEFRETNDLKIERLRLMDAIKKATEKKAVSEALQLIAQCTVEGRAQALTLFDKLAESKCIKASQAHSYKKEIKVEYAILKYLRDNLDVCAFSVLSSKIEAYTHYTVLRAYIDRLLKAGLIESHAFGYCWKGAKEEKEKLQKEAEKRKQCEIRRIAAYEEACARVESQIKDETNAKVISVYEEYNIKLRSIQREIEEENAENERKKQELERQISNLRSQQASLGFFKSKEKKALQIQIDAVQEKINAIPSAQQVQSSFQSRIDQMNNAKRSEADKVIAEVRSHYTMPRLEDFTEA